MIFRRDKVRQDKGGGNLSSAITKQQTTIDAISLEYVLL
jgi:hypothetical protein